MKLLFDEQLSPRLVHLLSDVFPESAHVHDLGLGSAKDAVVFEHARTHGFCIVTKDGDFADLAITRESPPRILWLRTGNCPTSDTAALLRTHASAVRAFADDQDTVILALTDDR